MMIQKSLPQQSSTVFQRSCKKQTLKQQEKHPFITDKQQAISPQIILVKYNNIYHHNQCQTPKPKNQNQSFQSNKQQHVQDTHNQNANIQKNIKTNSNTQTYSSNTQNHSNKTNKYPHHTNNWQQESNNSRQNNKHKFVNSIINQQPCTIVQSQQKHNATIINKKAQNHTYCTNYIKSIRNSNQLILVYLMYKDQKLSLFLNKGVSFDELLRRMYRQIYIYEKQTHCISNAILKNLLYKITGFQSIDNDLYYDYQLKYRRGDLNRQKFFVPFKQEDLKMPFKIYTKLNTSKFNGNQQYLVRNYSDGQWAILTAIKKANFDQEKLNIIKKSLKVNFSTCFLLLKNSPSYFSQFNWFETKHHIIIASQFFPESLQENLIKYKDKYGLDQSAQIFKFYAKWLAYLFKMMVQNNAQIFKNIKLRQICLNAFDGYPKLNVLQNVISCIDFGQRRRSVIQNGRRVQQKINDKFYQQTYIHLIQNLASIFKEKSTDSLDQLDQQKDKSVQITDRFKSTTNNLFKQPNNSLLQYMNTILQISKSQNFNFQQILKNQLLFDMNMTSNVTKRQKHPLQVDFDTKFKNMIQSISRIKISSSQPASSTIQISQLKDQIQKTFSLQAIRRNQQRNQNKSIIQLISTKINGVDLTKQNIFNLSEFKKQQQRKYQIKNKQKLYVQQIINQLNQNQNFIKTTKQNNLASIQFYLKQSDQKIKRKMISKLQTKYKKFFQKKQASYFEQQQFFKTKDLSQETNKFCYSQKTKINRLVYQRNNSINTSNVGQTKKFYKTNQRIISNNSNFQQLNTNSEHSYSQKVNKQQFNSSIVNDEKEQKDQIKYNRKKNNSLQPLLFYRNPRILTCEVQNSNKSISGMSSTVDTGKNINNDNADANILGIEKSKSTLKINFSLICQQDIERTQRHQQRTSTPKKASNLMNKKRDNPFKLFKQKFNIPSPIFKEKDNKNTLFEQKDHNNVLFKQKGTNLSSSLKKSRLQQLFVNSRDYLKEQKMELKKKQYGIYLQQGQKQYNKIKVYKKKQERIIIKKNQALMIKK